MTADTDNFHRRSLRLPGYDYAQSGAYFVTIVAAGRECIFGSIADGETFASPAGKIVQAERKDLPRRFGFLELGAFVVMPNHIHGIIIIRVTVGATRPALNMAFEGEVPLPSVMNNGAERSPLRPRLQRKSLGAIIAQFKPRVTKRIWKLPHRRGIPIWQRNYYEHVIRNQEGCERIHRYIESNRVMWAEDEENPAL
jgi:REP element-mobilizing transposase RayT